MKKIWGDFVAKLKEEEQGCNKKKKNDNNRYMRQESRQIDCGVVSFM